MRERTVDGRQRKTALALAERLEYLGRREIAPLGLQQPENGPPRGR